VKRRLPVLQPSPLPSLYAGWVDTLLAGPIPHEMEATCDDCAMLAPAASRVQASELFYDPRTKCCTYVPTLANFLVGRILADEDPAFAAGRATIEARLRAGVAVTPLGLGQPPTFTALYENTALNSFGRSPSLRCPHYLEEQGGRCGVWKHRASVCATWFCKHVRGATGMRFWRTLHQLLGSVELSLSRWCLLELDIGAEALAGLFPAPTRPGRAETSGQRTLDDLVNRGASRALWGRWYGQEADFYRECGRLVSKLSWDDVVAIGGPDVRIFSRLTTKAYRRLTFDDTPARLKVGALNVMRMDRKSCRVWAHDGSDPLELPRALMDLLPYFDGRPTAEALQAVEAEEGVRIDPALIRRLVDFEILVPREP
jgi:hypothetical protein